MPIASEQGAIAHELLATTLYRESAAEQALD
jgi:hypothetical protein